ncbi:MAG: M28 family peptidase [Gammaproteobacteria bacterium]
MAIWKKLAISAARILAAVTAVLLITWVIVAQPTFKQNAPAPLRIDVSKLRSHVEMLARTFYPRDWRHTDNLDRSADYIASRFEDAGASVEFQAFDVKGKRYRNVIGRFGTGKSSKIVVGAHYDAVEGTPGADDNASGVAALIELAYLLGREAPERDLELVAYTLEEPPFFATRLMGNGVHAKSIAAAKSGIAGVIVLEMVGYFNDAWGSQSYPIPLLNLIYPSRGNYIAVVGTWNQGNWVKTVKTAMQGVTDLPVYSLRAPSIITGVDFSDHRNYWPYGINAVMVTDTAFYRNDAYHAPNDTPDKLNYGKVAKVVTAVFGAIKSIGLGEIPNGAGCLPSGLGTV